MDVVQGMSSLTPEELEHDLHNSDDYLPLLSKTRWTVIDVTDGSFRHSER